jgi:heme/copper-type cytochrome/quinol oxidase subunit 2
MSREIFIYIGIFFAVVLLGFTGSYLYTIRQKGTAITNTTQQILNTHIPDPGEQAQELGIAIPQSVVPFSSESINKTRFFRFDLDNNELPYTKIIVAKGDAIQILFYARNTAYTFVLPQFNINQTIEANSGKTIEFTAGKAGVFPFECTSCSNKGTFVVVGNE